MSLLIVDGFGNQICTSSNPTEGQRSAQAWADRLQTDVWLTWEHDPIESDEYSDEGLHFEPSN